ncbi:unnamed protein product [Microthlaspi erraticum]|uniref:Uncharacterized protein n=1 Tax=Microthlaspi erraticum TaxID=1685480 RepID=A0A6D2IL45_9BRAS|nr:unnamed protein product [Microthlaspi erraticum]
MPRTTMPRELGNKASRPRNLSRVPRPMAPSEPGNYVPRPAKNSSANLHPSDHSGRPRIRPATTVPIVLGAAMISSGVARRCSSWCDAAWLDVSRSAASR